MDERIGLALSGGGFRAAAFHLGVLKRLEELEILQRITRVSTVSGGSITGALYALKCRQHGNGKPGDYAVEALISDMRAILTSSFRWRALFGDWRRKLRTSASIVRVGTRVGMVSETLDRDLFCGAMLCEAPPWLLVNATNVLTGKAWRFFCDRAGDYLIGATDKTDSILLADAVTASAAFPGFVECLPFRTRWQDLRGELLDDRWQKPPNKGTGEFSRWRKQYGRTSGELTVPLTDGGLYDNEGLEGLRSSRITHAIYACTAPPESSDNSRWRVSKALRLVDILHSRLGDLTRRLAHEMTHGIHPNDARRRLLEIADEIKDSKLPDAARIVDELYSIAGVGWPPRGLQYRASAPILIHRTDLAENVFATFSPPLDVPPEHRGLHPALVDALARVRTDLDSFSPFVIDLLISQAYFLTDAHIRLAMPELMPKQSPKIWDWAKSTIAQANSNERTVLAELGMESKRHWLGR